MLNYRRLLLGLMAFFFLLWFVMPLVAPFAMPLINLMTLPFRNLGIFVHEMGHGLFTLLSGGRFFWFQMEWNRGGVAITSGGFQMATLLGGLLGPTLMGALLLIVSTREGRVKHALWGLSFFFVFGIYYMLKPLFLSEADFPLLQQWELSSLINILLPLSLLLICWRLLSASELAQRFFLQVMGILMCYSGYSDTRYIFRYEPLSNGLYSDVRVLASSFGPSPENVPFFLFVMVAIFVSLLNFGLMIWAVRKALIPTANRLEQTTVSDSMEEEF